LLQRMVNDRLQHRPASIHTDGQVVDGACRGSPAALFAGASTGKAVYHRPSNGNISSRLFEWL
jgi:hypothetical protein